MRIHFETAQALAAHLWNEHKDTRYVGSAMDQWALDRDTCPVCDEWTVDGEWHVREGSVRSSGFSIPVKGEAVFWREDAEGNRVEERMTVPEAKERLEGVFAPWLWDAIEEAYERDEDG